MNKVKNYVGVEMTGLSVEDMREVDGERLHIGGGNYRGYNNRRYPSRHGVREDYDAGYSSPSISVTYDDEDKNYDISFGDGIGTVTFSFY